MLNDYHKNALSDAKSAVRAYAKEPSDRNAVQVQLALETVKDLKETVWREHLEEWLKSN